MTTTPAKAKSKNLFLRMLPVQRFVISVALAGIMYLLLSTSQLEVMIKVMIA